MVGFFSVTFGEVALTLIFDTDFLDSTLPLETVVFFWVVFFVVSFLVEVEAAFFVFLSVFLDLLLDSFFSFLGDKNSFIC